MSAIETIDKLRKITVANGATAAEERTAAEKIGRLFQRDASLIASQPAVRRPQATVIVDASHKVDAFTWTLWRNMTGQTAQDARNEPYVYDRFTGRKAPR